MRYRVLSSIALPLDLAVNGCTPRRRIKAER